MYLAGVYNQTVPSTIPSAAGAASNMRASSLNPTSGSPGMHLGMGVAAGAAASVTAGMQQVQLTYM